MDMLALLEKLMTFAGEKVGQKPGDQVRGTEKAKMGTKKHPFAGRLVGSGESAEPQGNMLGELDRVAKDTAIERDLAEQWAQFKEEAFQDTEDKRPSRKGARPPRGHEPQQRYHYKKEQETDESRGHKVIATKLKDIERAKNPPAEVDLKQREAQAKAEYRKYVEKMKKKNPDFIPLYKLDELDGQPTTANVANAAAGGTTVSTDQAKKQAGLEAAALNKVKSTLGLQGTTSQIGNVLDTAAAGKPINPAQLKQTAGLMGAVDKITSNPQLAGQFTNLVKQAEKQQQLQQQQTQQPK